MSIYYTIGTAQGGGGSFRNRKPKGEVGVCGSPGGSSHPQLLDVGWYGAAVVVAVAWWNCSRGVMKLAECSGHCICGGVMSVVQCNVG